MKCRLSFFALWLVISSIGCSSPAKVEIQPKTLVLEGKGTEGKLTAKIFTENGKELTGEYDVTWMCLDEKTIKLRQDGTAIAMSSGKALVDVEITGSDTPGLPGTGIHGTGEVIVRIPGWIEMSHENLQLVEGAPPTEVWAEVRNDQNHTMKGYLPTWKVDNPNIIAIKPSTSVTETRRYLELTPLAVGETFITAVFQDLAADILVVVSPPAPTVTEDR